MGELAKMSCPICKKDQVAKYRPFCSKRCADVDLGRWFNGTYAIPALGDEDIEAANAALQNVPNNLH